jgi:hypothetical protein
MTHERKSAQHPACGGIDASDHLARQGITVRELSALSAVVDLRMAAAVLHVGRSKTYRLARRGEFTWPLLRIDNTCRVPTAHLPGMVGVSRLAIPGDEHP